MAEAKQLNRNQLLSLFEDILKQDVKRYGTYTFEKINITISMQGMTNAQRVNLLQFRRRINGRCISCGAENIDSHIRCSKCRDRQNKLRRKGGKQK